MYIFEQNAITIFCKHGNIYLDFIKGGKCFIDLIRVMWKRTKKCGIFGPKKNR